MIDRRILFDGIRRAPANGHLTVSQVDGIGRILDEWDRRDLTDLRWLANMLAEVWHETGAKMQPVREGGSDAYLRAKPYWPWTGRGLVQVTWEANGVKFGAKVPDDLMGWPCALRALFDGMSKGMFTGRKLGDYFSAKVDDPTNARRIINGVDKAALIAGYHAHFLVAIKAASAGTVSSLQPVAVLPAPPHEATPPAPPEAAVAPRPAVIEPAPAPPADHPSLWARLAAALHLQAA